MRAPGMSLVQMPVFTLTALCNQRLDHRCVPGSDRDPGAVDPDRYLGFHFFTNEMGGNRMMYVNLIWVWGHPEVYILVLPVFGVFAEHGDLSPKTSVCYTNWSWATIAITVLSFIVWLHHFFTMGRCNVNAFFGIMTMTIAIPTGVKIFNWLFTMYQGRIQMHSPTLDRLASGNF